jgi:hypothetical protein
MASAGCTSPSPYFPALNWNRVLAIGFLALSALDLLLTWLLLKTPGTCFYEANPLAGFILDVAGWWGLGLFKLACAGTVVGASALLVGRHPGLARGVLAVACPVLCLVVGYSLRLTISPERHQLLAVQEQANSLGQMRVERVAYQNKLTQLAYDVILGRRTLANAVGALKAHLATQHFSPLHALEVYYPDLSDEARLGVAVVREATFALRDNVEGLPSSVARLRAEFAATFACPFPRAYGDPYAASEAGASTPPAAG